MIKKALELGYTNLMIGIGGSATNDGGVGLAQALGVEFKTQGTCNMDGSMLSRITGVNMRGLDPALKDAKLTVICDVTNILLGNSGATYTFGAQKGADDKTLGLLEAGMRNLAEVIKRDTGADLSNLKGGGAAGGTGAMLSGLLGAEFRQGIDAILDMVEFDRIIEDADVVITGEGRIDSQSADGKVLSGVGKRCMAKGVPALAVCGILGDGYERIFNSGINNVFPAVAHFTDFRQMLSNKELLMQQAADRLFRSLQYC
jgi:glycerate kinase